MRRWYAKFAAAYRADPTLLVHDCTGGLPGDLHPL